MSSPGTPSTPAVPPSTPDASFAPQLPAAQLNKLDIPSPSNNAGPTPQPKNVLRKSISSHPAYKRAREAADKAADSARRQVVKLRAHPAAVRTGDICAKQAQNARELLGHSDAVVDAERITGIDRLFLVFSAALLFVALVPANLLGLAAPVTTAIVAARPTYHAYNALTDEKEDVKHLLTFYVALGLCQTLEGCVPTWVLDAIPRYYMCKLILLTYLGHPRFKLYDYRQKQLAKSKSKLKPNDEPEHKPKQQPKPSSIKMPEQAYQTWASATPTPPLDCPSSQASSPLAAFGVTAETQAQAQTQTQHMNMHAEHHKYGNADAVRNGSVKNWAKTSAIPRPAMPNSHVMH